MIPPILAMSALEMSQFTWALATASEVVKGDLKRAEKLRGLCGPKFQTISTPTAYPWALLPSSLAPGKDEGRWPPLPHCKKAFLVVGQPNVRGTRLGPCGKGGNVQMLTSLKKKKSLSYSGTREMALTTSPSSSLLPLDLLSF